MYALMSGQAGRVAFFYGASVKVLDLNGIENGREFPISEAGHLFSGLSDVRYISPKSEQVGMNALQLAQNQDRALLMAIMLLDAKEGTEFRLEAANILDEFFTTDVVKQYVNYKLYRAPLDGKGDIQGAIGICSKNEALSKWLTHLDRDQRAISICRESWDCVASDICNGAENKTVAEDLLVDLGVFYEVAQAISDNNKGKIDQAQFAALKSRDFLSVPQNRELLRQWLAPITPATSKADAKNLITEGDQEAHNHKKRKQQTTYRSRSLISNHEKFSRAKSQIEEIKKLLRLQDVAKARKFANELCASQIESGDNGYAVLSLCNISKYARDVYQESFSLEVIQKAVEINPEDGWSWGELADAYIDLHKYEEAENALGKAELWGERHFAENGRARILKHQGFLSKAKEAFAEIVNNFSFAEDVWTSSLGLGDVLRDLGEYDQSLKVFSDAIERFPAEPRLRCGFAATLKEIGQLHEALAAYKDSNDLAGKSPDAYIGMSQVHRELGDVETATKIVKEACDYYPNESDVFSEYAYDLLLLEQFDNSLRIYKQLQTDHPYDYSGFKGVAEVYRAQKCNDLSMDAYGKAIKLFPHEVPIHLRRASLYKEAGDLEKTLQAYSEILYKFPNSSPAKFGQANLFKELGQFDTAIELYEVVEDERASFNTTAAIAAVHVVRGNYEKALEKLTCNTPRTKSEWVAFHIKGMALLKVGKVADALNVFQYGLDNITFIDQNSYFVSALALAKMQKHEFNEALKIIPTNMGAVSNVFLLHIYGSMGEMQLAEKAYNALEREYDPNLISLRDELGARLHLNDNKPQYDEAWIFEHECNALTLQASYSQAA
ncbi:MAG: tetratricopeptide repeat protein [Rhodospirillales bacterium]|nr:tetratricopeptide repeat protein [Rhodospirillales bacterium]